MMMTMKTIRLLHLLSYIIVASQFIFYMLILVDALKSVGIANFLENRRAVDPLMQARWKGLYYACLLLGVAVVALSARNPGSWVFITSAIALACLLVDVALALKGNEPINRMVNATPIPPGSFFDVSKSLPKGGFMSAGGDLIDWEAVRLQWLRLVELRGVFTVTGLLSLLAGLVYGK